MTDWNAVGFITASQYRAAVVTELGDCRASTPAAIADATENGQLAHISRALGELREKGLVELLVDEDTKKGRLYGLTDEGREIAEELDDVAAVAGEGND